MGAGEGTVWGWWERFEGRGGNGLRGRGGRGMAWGMGDGDGGNGLVGKFVCHDLGSKISPSPEGLPGVGRKTANVVLNMWWKQPAQAVDTHIFRVGNRTGIAPGKTVDAVERAVEDNIPADFQLHAHHWLILHGRYHCKARKPLCKTCIIRDLCPFEEKNI